MVDVGFVVKEQFDSGQMVLFGCGLKSLVGIRCDSSIGFEKGLYNRYVFIICGDFVICSSSECIVKFMQFFISIGVELGVDDSVL